MLGSNMSQMSKLMQVTEEEKEKILKELNMTEKEFEDSVQVLRSWFNQLDNIRDGAVISDNQFRIALLNSKMSMEKAKRTLEAYLTCKTLYFDYFQHMVPGEKLRKTATFMKSVIMPKLLPSLSRLHVARIEDSQSEAENGVDYYLMAMMIAELRMCNDFSLSTSVLIDLENFSFKNFMKFTPTVNYLLVHLLTSLSLRIGHIHMLNIPSFYDKVSMLLRAILPKKLFEKIIIHNSYEDLHKYIPKEYLPSDYGGEERSLNELQELWVKELEVNEELLINLNNLRVKEVLKVPQLSMDVGMGMEGSFKKLDID